MENNCENCERRKPLRIVDMVSIAMSMITIMTVICAGFFWFYKTNALPNRMDKAEARLTTLENGLIENRTKTDLIYQSILRVETHILNKK